MKPSITHLKIFSSITYSLINAQSRYKLDEKSKKFVFVSYCNESNAYKLFNLAVGNVIVSRNVTFDEDASWS